ncbi:MAG TPA: hypothetical protein VIF02_07350 [Methylocella sp.]
MVAFEVHRIAGLVLDPYLGARRFGEVIENLRGFALGKLGAIEIDADRNAAVGGARERLPDGPVGQHTGRHVDLVPGANDKRNVDMFEVFRRRILNDRRRIGAAWCQGSEEEDCGQRNSKLA